MRSSTRSALGNPVLVGAVTLLVVIVAVFLAYNANAGLPFVPTTQLKIVAPNATKLVRGNEVREGGYRVGVIADITPARLPSGESAAQIEVKIDQKAAPVPVDSTVAIRPRSALGLRYVELIRGRDKKTLADGATIKISRRALAPEFEDFFAMFRPQTRRDIQANLTEFGAAFAGRGDDLNRTIASLPRFLGSLENVTELLADPDTQLARFFDELEDAARVTAPVADRFAEGFSFAADTFEAISRDPQALQDTISKSPETLRVGTESFRAQRPFLRRLASISPQLRSTSAELRRSLPPINAALATGTPILRRTPPLNKRVGDNLAVVRDFSNEPSTGSALRGLTATVKTLNPTLKFAGPAVTVCNFWNYWWTNLSDHISEEDATGTIQRIQVKNAPNQDNELPAFGARGFANGEGADPVTVAADGDPAFTHAQAYGAAVDAQGNADCENGQRGYVERLAKTASPELKIAIDPRTPGSQGTTFTGRPRVPEGQTFTAEPETGFRVTP